MKRIYMDNAATTAVDKRVLEKMLPYFSEIYGNPSSLHSFGREAKKAVDTARKQVADAIGAKPEEIIFTGGGSEGDNMIIRGIAKQALKSGKGKHIITTAVEHPAILQSPCGRPRATA